jgi:hypothetical protein
MVYAFRMQAVSGSRMLPLSSQWPGNIRTRPARRRGFKRIQSPQRKRHAWPAPQHQVGHQTALKLMSSPSLPHRYKSAAQSTPISCFSQAFNSPSRGYTPLSSQTGF